jgi:hypothetical protein
LRIECNHGHSWIEIIRRGDDRYAWFEIGCAVDIGHGHFFAKNSDIQFLNGAAFLTELDRFVLDRDRTPQLDGTYGSFLILWRAGSHDEVMLSFAIGDAFCGGPVTSEFNLTGSFALLQERLSGLVADFRTLLEGARPSELSARP